MILPMRMDVVCDVVVFEEALRKHKSAFAARTDYRAEREDLSGFLQHYTGEFTEDPPDERLLSDECELLGIHGYVRLETLGVAHESQSAEELIPLAQRGRVYDRLCEPFHFHPAAANRAGGARPLVAAACEHYEEVLGADPCEAPSPRMIAWKREVTAQATLEVDARVRGVRRAAKMRPR